MHTNSVYADLHTHTHCSDGTRSPKALVQKAAEHGVQALAVTDHDTVAGLEAARAAAEATGVRFVNGVELSVEAEGRSIHLLGYGFDPDHKALVAYLSAFTNRRRERFDQMVERLSDAGVSVPDEILRRHVEMSVAPGRPHLARALVAAGQVETYREAFAEYLGREQPGYVPAPTQPVATAIDALHAAGGVAVVAHPGQWMPREILGALRTQGLDGIECICPSHPDYLVDYYRDICRTHGLLVTGGSDDHGGADPEQQRLGVYGLTKPQWERFRTSAL